MGDALLVDGIGTADMNANSIALDATSVYWLNADLRLVEKCGKDGTARTTVASNLVGPVGIAVSDGYVYFSDTNYSYVDNKYGAVLRVPLQGGNVQTIVGNVWGVAGLAVDATDVYYVNDSDGSVWRVPKAGGAPTALVGPSSNQSGAFMLAVDDDSVYFATDGFNDADKAIRKVSKSGGVVSTLVPSYWATDLALDQGNVYYVEWATGDLMKVSKSGGAPATVVSGAVATVAVDATNAYFSYYSYSLGKAPIAGGSETDLAQETPASIAVDDTYVFFATRGPDAQLRRVGK